MRTLGDIVDEYLISAGYDSRHNYSRLLNIAVRGLRELTYDTSGISTWATLELDNNGRADIPEGMIKILGVYTANGTPIVSSNKGIPTIIEPDGEATSGAIWLKPSLLSPEANSFNSAEYFRNGEFKGGVFSGGGGNPYTYFYNMEIEKLEFSSNCEGSPVIKYLTDLKAVSGKYYVHPFIENAIMMYIDYADYRFKKSSNAATTREKHRVFVDAKIWARQRLTAVNRDEMRDARSKSYRLTPK